MKIKTLNISGNKNETTEISDKILKSKFNNKLIKQVIDWQINHAKTRTAKTKQRNEVIGSTIKIVPQKGSGGARHASRKAPIFVGGGVAHGPKGESNYKQRKINKSEKKNSISSLISEKNKLNSLIIFNDFEKEIKKTKEMNNLLIKFDAKSSLLILDKKSKEKIYKSIKNIPNVKATDVNHFNAFDIVKYKKLIITETAVKEIEKRYA